MCAGGGGGGGSTLRATATEVRVKCAASSCLCVCVVVHETPLQKTLMLQHKLEEATQAYTRALKVLEDSVGKSHPAYGETLAEMGHVLDEDGRHEEAIALYIEGQDVLEEVCGRNHASVRNIVRNIGVSGLG